MNKIKDILRGAVIGVANIIPGVSGGTMMVSMGIYDTIIGCINRLFTDFVQCVRTLWPFAVGMAAAIVGLSFVIEPLFAHFPLQTNCAFIGLIFGGLPVLLRRLRGKRKGAPGALAFVLAFALIIALQIIGEGDGSSAVIRLNPLQMAKLLGVGVIASATMVIPGVSGSMMLMLLGYYEPVISSISGLVRALTALDGGALLYNAGVLAPFGIGVVAGIFLIAKLIEILLARWEGVTYCAIIGLVSASPIAILMTVAWAQVTLAAALCSVLTFAAGFAVAYRLSE